MTLPRLSRRAVLRSAAVIGLSAPLAGFTWVEAMLAPRAEPWPHWSEADDGNRATIDHALWTAFLARYVVTSGDGVNRLRYGEVSNRDAQALNAYIERLTALPVGRFARSEQLAYWINLYNARTVRLILDHYPLASIMELNISPGLLSSGPWGKKLLSVDGVALSLNDIEHRILRPGWADNRLHYALNCASVGCPNLAATAFSVANTERLLAAGAQAYVNHPRGVRLDGGAVVASKVYAWFKADFGGDDRGVLDHLRLHAAPELKASLAAASAISSYEYDWSLNDARGSS